VDGRSFVKSNDPEYLPWCGPKRESGLHYEGVAATSAVPWTTRMRLMEMEVDEDKSKMMMLGN